MKDPNVQIWCQDEVHFQRHSTLTRMWACRGQQPSVVSASTRQKVSFFGAVNPKTGSLLTQEASTFNGQTFGDFVRYLLQNTKGKVYLVLDNAPWHKARDLKELFHKNRRRVERIFLPPYSPELNPAERVWRISRRHVTHNRYFASVQEMHWTLTSHFAKWKQPNSTLKTLCAYI